MHSNRIIAWTVWIVASIFYSYQYVLRVMPNIMLSEIMEQFNIDAATFGQFSGVYYIGYSLVHLPVGIMLDRYGPRKVMTSCILLSVTGLLPLIFSDHWIYPILGRFVLGIGSSAAILGVFKIIRMTFSEGHFSRMLSLSATIGLMGAIYGGGPVSYLKDILGYHPVVELLAAAGVVLAIVTYWVVPDIKSSSEPPTKSDILAVLSNSKVLWACLSAGLLVGPMEGFVDVWGSAFLKQVYGYEEGVASTLPSLIFIGMCFGAPLLSLIAEKIGNNLLTITGTGVIMTLSFFSMLIWQLPPMTLSIVFVFVGVCCAYQILALTQISTYVPEKVAGVTTAIANMIIMIFGYVFHSTIGGLIDVAGGTASSQALFYGISIVPLGLTIGTVGFVTMLIREKSQKEALESV